MGCADRLQGEKKALRDEVLCETGHANPDALHGEQTLCPSAQRPGGLGVRWPRRQLSGDQCRERARATSYTPTMQGIALTLGPPGTVQPPREPQNPTPGSELSTQRLRGLPDL